MGKGTGICEHAVPWTAHNGSGRVKRESRRNHKAGLKTLALKALRFCYLLGDVRARASTSRAKTEREAALGKARVRGAVRPAETGATIGAPTSPRTRTPTRTCEVIG